MEDLPMARPPAKDLTDRELEVMHVFWSRREATATEARDQLAAHGLDRTYPTVANLVRILLEKGFLEPVNAERPFRYRPVRSYEQVSGRLLGDLLERVFRGSRAQLLVRLVGERTLTAQERSVLEAILKEQPS
jgi:BlaI family transcriptional regulator, penicillinase repressor